MKKKSLVFVKMNELKVPEKYEGIFSPAKFNSQEYLTWKHNKNDRKDALEKIKGSEFSLIEEVYETIEQNFISTIDRQYMLWANFLTDPKDPTGIIKYVDGKEVKEYPTIKDAEARFSGKRKDLYSDFITTLRAMTTKEPVVAPEYVIKALNIGDLKDNEYALTLDSISRDSWKKIYRWSVLRAFIDGRVGDFPGTDTLMEMYGNNPDDGEIHITENILKFDGFYVDLMDCEDSLGLITDLRLSNGLEEEDIIVYDVQC